MKNIIAATFILFPVIASASFLQTSVMPSQRDRTRSCHLSTCAANDRGQTYTNMCSDYRRIRAGMMSDRSLVLQTTENGRTCVCWCDYGYEERARNL